jgi:hypothetical protein
MRVAVGDVFRIPIDDSRFALGQIAGNWKGELYVVVFEGVVAGDASPADVEGRNLLFAALTLDAKLHHGHWPIIGRFKSNLDDVPQPMFKVRQEGQPYIESRDRSFTRPASSAEANVLRYRTVSSPAVIDNAVKANHGQGEWLLRYEDLRADYAFESARVIAAK